MAEEARIYPRNEEALNIASHAVGFALSWVALILLVVKALPWDDALYLLSFATFGVCLIVLYGTSTAYHAASTGPARRRWRAADHAAIYLLIAGTYTPFTLLVLDGRVGLTVFAASWSMAAVGIVLKIFYAGRYRLFSTVMYVAMGWIIVFAIGPLVDAFSGAGLWWLVAGGILYTVGALVYAIRGLPYGHAIFHVFVVGGSICHFVAVYGYIMPPAI